MTVRLPLIFSALLGASLAASASAAAPAGYHLAQTVPLGSPDRWDYVVFDAPSQRVYVAHGDRVTVVNGRNGEVLGDVRGIPGGTHGTAVAAGRGFTDDGKAGQAVAFDLTTLKVTAHIPAADDADGIVTDPVTGHVFVADGDSGKITVIDPHTDRALANLEGGGKLEGLVASGDGRVFVDGAEKRDVVVVDARANRVTAHWNLPTCVSPHGIAYDGKERRLFVTCVNAQMVVVNADTGSIVATLPIGRGSDAAAWDPKRKRAFSSNGLDGTISVIAQRGPDSYVALDPVPTEPTARTMAVDPASGRLYVVAAEVAAPSSANPRPQVKPGSLHLLFLDPER